MGATEAGIHNLARSRGFNLVPQITRQGLSNRGHLDPLLMQRAQPRELECLAAIFARLGGDDHRLGTKRVQALRLDFYAPDHGVLIEIDEIQHFTTEREKTLNLYPPALARNSTREYRTLIEIHHENADRYRATKPATDFPVANGRRAQRAYLDAVRDIAAQALNLRLIRVPAPECDPLVAFARLELAIHDQERVGVIQSVSPGAQASR